MIRATREEVELYLKNFGKRGEKVLSTLGKLQPFMECVQSEIGFTLLRDLIDRYEALLEKVSNLEATEIELLELKTTKSLILSFATRINEYNNRVSEIKTVAKKEAK